MSSFPYNDPSFSSAPAVAPVPSHNEFSAAELETLSLVLPACRRSSLRAYIPACIALFCMTYVVPTALQLLLINRVNAYACALIGCVVGCCFLLMAGLRRTAIALYATLALLEIAMIYSPWPTDQAVLIVSNLIPTLVGCWLLTRRAV